MKKILIINIFSFGLLLLAGCKQNQPIQSVAPDPTIATPFIEQIPEFDNAKLTRKEANILLQEIENPNMDVGTAFSLFSDNFICLNTGEHPIDKEENVKNTKKIFCDKYYFIERYKDSTGPVLFGPYYDGELIFESCEKTKVKNACYFVSAVKTKDNQVCDKISDPLWKEKCIKAVAFKTGNLLLCDNLLTLKEECYQDFVEGDKVSEKICSQVGNSGDNCFDRLSKKEGDITYCARIKDENGRDRCYSDPIISDYTRENYKNLEENKANCDNQEIFYNESRKSACQEFMQSIEK